MTFQERPATFKKLAWSSLAGFLFVTFCGLGIWQLLRLESKLELIAQVESRAFGHPVVAPGPESWTQMGRDGFEYLRLQVTGRFLEEHTVYTLAVTKLGSGFWMLTPLRTTEGFDVWVNRGFVPARPSPEHSAADLANRLATEPARQNLQHQSVLGLLRLSEPDGGFLRANKPEEERWYSRDVLAMSAYRGLTHTAPYFVDAFEVRDTTLMHSKKQGKSAPAHNSGQALAPVPGLTVLKFHNNHLVYALTWFGLALMVAGVSAWILLSKGAKADSPHDQ